MSLTFQHPVIVSINCLFSFQLSVFICNCLVRTHFLFSTKYDVITGVCGRQGLAPFHSVIIFNLINHVSSLVFWLMCKMKLCINENDDVAGIKYKLNNNK